MEYQVIRSDRKTLAVEVKAGSLIVRAPERTTQEEIRRFLLRHQKWIDVHMAKAQERQKEREGAPALTGEEIRSLAGRALEVIPERVAYYAPLVGVTYGRITIRNQKTRWGSCSSKGNLNFNCLLMLTPIQVTDSVVVHELCHRKEMNHSDRFYAEVLRVYPDYWKWNRWLKEHEEALMARMFPNR